MSCNIPSTKSFLTALLASSALALAGTGALAQTSAPDASDSDATPPASAQMPGAADTGPAASDGMASDDLAADNAAPQTSDGFIALQQPSQTLASSLIGMNVLSDSGDDADNIGKISDLILNEDQQVTGVIIGVGGFLGMGQKEVAIPWSEISIMDTDDKTAIIELSKEALEQAPAFATLKDQQKEQERQQQDMRAPQ